MNAARGMYRPPDLLGETSATGSLFKLHVLVKSGVDGAKRLEIGARRPRGCCVALAIMAKWGSYAQPLVVRLR
jgi:hypothetical protein